MKQWKPVKQVTWVNAGNDDTYFFHVTSLIHGKKLTEEIV